MRSSKNWRSKTTTPIDADACHDDTNIVAAAVGYNPLTLSEPRVAKRIFGGSGGLNNERRARQPATHIGRLLIAKKTTRKCSNRSLRSFKIGALNRESKNDGEINAKMRGHRSHARSRARATSQCAAARSRAAACLSYRAAERDSEWSPPWRRRWRRRARSRARKCSLRDF